MYEQMNLFDYLDDTQGYHYCKNCKNAKFKERSQSAGDIYYCHIARSFITEHTIDITFHKNCFERRGND